MANFSVPNLCGASAELNAASSKIADLELNITSQIDAVASEAAAAVNTALADVKAGLDGLALDLPSLPSINFQSELTSLVSDFNLTTPQGLAQYTSKLAELEKDFGDTLTKAGKSLDSLITDATAAVSGGGDLCAIAPNLELPAAGGDVVEKAQGVKTALKNAADEVESTVTVNASVETKKTALKAKVESVKTGEVFVKADPIKDVEPVVTKIGKTVKVTTTNKSVTVEPNVNPNNPNNLSREELRNIIQGRPKKRKTQSDKGLSRKVYPFVQKFVLKGSINEKIWDDRKHKVIDDVTNIKLFIGPFKIDFVSAHIERSAADLSGDYVKVKDKTKLIYTEGNRRRNKHSIIPEFTGKQLTLKDGPKNLNIASATRVIVKYKFYSTVDTDYSG